jgi:hypothetical protein
MSMGDPWYPVYLIGTHQHGRKKGSSLTGVVVCPLGTVCCCTNSSSVLCCTTHARSGVPLPAAMSGSCKCYNPRVFALRSTHFGTLVKGKFTRIWGFLFRQPHRGVNRELRLKVVWCGEPLTSATWKAPTSTKGCLKSLSVNRRGRMYSRPVEATSTRRPNRRIVQYPTLLCYPDWGFPCFSSVVM